MPEKTIALVLSGGGARAAYQVGMLKGIASLYEDTKSIPFQVICGTSAGAINATTLACLASNFHLGVKKLDWIWSNMHTSKIYHSHAWPVTKHLLSMLGRSFRNEQHIQGAPSLLNNIPLRILLQRTIPFHLLDKQLDRGHLKALSIACSCYQNKRLLTFYQGKNCEPWQRVKHSGEATQINIDHLLASAAIPLVFPSVQIGDLFFGDGTIHQHAPLSAPIHLGAQKILVINLDGDQITSSQMTQHPSSAAITAHLLDTLFSDMLHMDLERLERINNTLDALNPNAEEDVELHKIDIKVLKPSQDLAVLAHQHADEMPKPIQILCRLLGLSKDSAPNLISYLLFEPGYCQDLIQLGERDALAQKENIAQFLKQD
tara:strand:- start:3759 stop:4880 length:1122 start_codon:yes stop_codon:yes gene_type:complete